MSLRKAINDKCKECIYDPVSRGNGTWREQVEACTSYSCPLYDCRPKTKSKRGKETNSNDVDALL